MKKIIRFILRKFGFEVRKINKSFLNDQPLTAKWIKDSEPEPNVDEVIKEGWVSNVLHMANKNYTPPNLSYLRTQDGEDYRIKYVAYSLDLRDQRVLEMGPFEGRHSVLIEKMGARENIAIEAREENYAKCLRIKEKYGLSKTTYYKLNIEDMYNHRVDPPFNGKFDLLFCLGLFYHLPDPGRALDWFITQSDALFLGTHYVESRVIHLYDSFEEGVLSYKGHSYKGRWYTEGGLKDALSGMSHHSFWLYEEDLIRMLNRSGYKSVYVLGKDYQYERPHITLLAKK